VGKSFVKIKFICALGQVWKTVDSMGIIKNSMVTSPQIEQFLIDLKHFISQSLSLDDLKISLKSDNSPVTHIDTQISNFCKNHPVCTASFYSEEEHGGLQFPAIVLDPIDGTKELVKMNGECVVSIAWMKNSSEGEALIYNPFTGFRLTSFDKPSWNPKTQDVPYLGLVSRSEINSMRDLKDFKHLLVAKGSIAFKLGLLASGGCDFVVSLKPKSIWDIAAGTLLGWQRGHVFYANGRLVKELDEKRYEPPLVWGRPAVVSEINHYFSSR